MIEYMEEILENVSNPFEFENFNVMLRLFCDSKDKYDFYGKIVTFYESKHQDKNQRPSLKKDLPYTEYREQEGWGILDGLGFLFPIDHRIYINASNTRITEMVEKFAQRCLERDLPYVLKYDKSGIGRNDSIVIYSSSETYKKYIDILREMALQDPTIKENCDNPPFLTGVLDGWIGLADEGKSKSRSYSEMMRDLIICSIYECIYENQNIFENFDSFNREEYERKRKAEEDEIAQMKLDESDREKLQQLISSDLSVAQKIYHIFMEKCRQNGRDSSNPIFDIKRQKQIKDDETKAFADDGELMEPLKKSDTTHILMCLSHIQNFDTMSLETKVKIMKQLIKKNFDDCHTDEKICIELRLLEGAEVLESYDFCTVEDFLIRDSPRYTAYFESQPIEQSLLTSSSLDSKTINERLAVIKDFLKERIEEPFWKNMLQKQQALQKLDVAENQFASRLISNKIDELSLMLSNKQLFQTACNNMLATIEKAINDGSIQERIIHYAKQQEILSR